MKPEGAALLELLLMADNGAALMCLQASYCNGGLVSVVATAAAAAAVAVNVSYISAALLFLDLQTVVALC